MLFQANEGILFVLSGPSGVGKGTVRKKLFEQINDLKYSISVTTRDMRPGEKDGVDYFFKTKNEFKQLIQQNKLLEYAKYVNNYYGTPRKYVSDTLKQGYDVLLEIEVQGALQVKQNFPQGVFIFLLPPNLEALKMRIMSRGTEDKDLVLGRLQQATKEIKLMEHYDYVVINDDVNRAVTNIKSIIQSEHCRQERQEKRLKKLLEDEIDVRTIY